MEQQLLWLRRRVSLLLASTYLVVRLPKTLILGVRKCYIGEGYFSDPEGNPGFFRFAFETFQFVLMFMLLCMRTPLPEALEAARNPINGIAHDGVVVEHRDNYMQLQMARKPFDSPKGQPYRVGVIILPGSQVPPVAYAPLARELARKGYPTVTVDAPFGSALYAMETVMKIIKRPQKEGRQSAPTKWILVGHSLGGLAANIFAHTHPDMVCGLAFMGVSVLNVSPEVKKYIPVLAIRGSRDPYTLGHGPLTEGAEMVTIEGGNHKGFGSYYHQPLDWKATIEPQEQQRLSAEALVNFIEHRVVHRGFRSLLRKQQCR